VSRLKAAFALAGLVIVAIIFALSRMELDE